MIRFLILIFSTTIVTLSVSAQYSISGYWKKSQCFIYDQELIYNNAFYKDRLLISIVDTNDIYLIKGYGDADSYLGYYNLNNYIFQPLRVIDASVLSFQKKPEILTYFFELVEEMFYFELTNDTLWFKNGKISISFTEPDQNELNIAKVASTSIDDLEKKNKKNMETIAFIKQMLNTQYVDYKIIVDSNNISHIDVKLYSEQKFLK